MVEITQHAFVNLDDRRLWNCLTGHADMGGCCGSVQKELSSIVTSEADFALLRENKCMEGSGQTTRAVLPLMPRALRKPGEY